jgi:hypothetical protein
MKKISILFLFLLFICSQTFAQRSTTYSATLKKMLQVAGTEATFSMAIKQMVSMFKEQKSAVPDSVWNALEAEFGNTSMDELVTMLVPVYEKHLTEKDLQEMIAFYQTPVGKKYAEKSPFIMQESMQVGQQWGMQVGTAFDEKLRAKGY